jgi:hypothetical protein
MDVEGGRLSLVNSALARQPPVKFERNQEMISVHCVQHGFRGEMVRKRIGVDGRQR